MVIFYRFLLTFTRPGNCWLLMVFFHTKGRHLGSQCLFALGIQHGHVFLPGQGPGAPVWWRNWLRLGGIPTLEVLKVSLKIIKIDLLKKTSEILYSVCCTLFIPFLLLPMFHETSFRRSYWQPNVLKPWKNPGRAEPHMVTFWILLGRIWTTFW